MPAIETLAGLCLHAGARTAPIQVVDVDIRVIDYDRLVEGWEAALALPLSARAALLDSL